MTTLARPMTDDEREYYERAPYPCLQTCSYEDSLVCRPNCPHYAQRQMARSRRVAVVGAPRAWGLHEPPRVDIADPRDGPVVQIFHPPSLRRRVLVWLLDLWQADPSAPVGYAIALFAVGLLLWHTAAAVVEGRLAW